MTMMQGTQEVVGSAYVVVAGGALGAASLSNGACSTLTRTGAGVVTVALNNQGSGAGTAGGGLSQTEHDFIVQVQSATFAAATVEWNSATLITVRTWDAAGAALDNIPFTLTVMRNRRLNN